MSEREREREREIKRERERERGLSHADTEVLGRVWKVRDLIRRNSLR